MSVTKSIIKEILLPFFKDVDKELRKAGIKKDLYEYLKDVLIYSIIISLSFGIVGFLIGFAIIYILRKPGIFFITFILFIVFSLIGFLISILLFRIYPSMLISSRAKKIENSLYLATIYMATIASSGANPLAIFELLSKYKEFKEISKESEDIVRMVKVLGLDLPTALHIKASNSPSKEWKELLEGIRSIIVEGGNLERFLYEKARQYIQDFKRKLLEYTNTMQVILEIYITMIIIGVIFILVLTTLLGSIMGGNVEAIKQIQLFLIVALLPLGTIMFILIIKAISPFES